MKSPPYFPPFPLTPSAGPSDPTASLLFTSVPTEANPTGLVSTGCFVQGLPWVPGLAEAPCLLTLWHTSPPQGPVPPGSSQHTSGWTRHRGHRPVKRVMSLRQFQYQMGKPVMVTFLNYQVTWLLSFLFSGKWSRKPPFLCQEASPARSLPPLGQ